MPPKIVGILGLTNEVLGLICSQFCPHCVGEDCLGDHELPSSFGGPEYFGTLVALTQVNRRIGDVARAIRAHVFCGRRESLPFRLRALVRDPALAAHIRVVRLGGDDGDQDCVLRELIDPEDFKKLEALVAPDFGTDLDLASALGQQRLLSPFQQLPPVEDISVAVERIANARLNAFLLFKLVKNIECVVMLGRWPLAVFPEPRQERARKASKVEPLLAVASVVDPGPLPKVHELRLGSISADPDTGDTHNMPDIPKCVGFISRLRDLRVLRVNGGYNSLSPEQIAVCRPALASVTTLDLNDTTISALRDLLLCCTPANIKHFCFTVSLDKVDIQPRTIVNLLEQYDLPATLESLEIDTSTSTLSGADPYDLRHNFRTVPSLAHFSSLRHLTISTDAIYFPSLFPRVLLLDPNTGPTRDDDFADDDDRSLGMYNQRLVDFLPRNIQTLEITGIYAIHSGEVANLARACTARNNQPGQQGPQPAKFPHLKKVTLQSYDNFGTRDIGWCNYPSHYNGPRERMTNLDYTRVDYWREVAVRSQEDGYEVEVVIRQLFARAGVEFTIDRSVFWFGRYVGSWDEDVEG